MADSEVVLGYFGNIWLRENIIYKKGDVSPGHYHLFDHISFLVKGKVKVTVDNNSKIFESPSIIVIKKDLVHDFEALTDDVRWFCVFAVRDELGGVSDIVPAKWNPFFAKNVDSDYWKKRSLLEDLSFEVEDKPYPSWKWDKEIKKWVAPTPYPVDGKLYDWDETQKKWLELFPHHPLLQK